MISTVLITYLIGWSAQSRVERRTGSYRVTAFGEPLVLNQPNEVNIAAYIDVEKYPWERVGLFICALY